MADSYICSGATMRCSMGTSQAKLTVLPSRTVFLTGQPMANISDHLTMTNLAPFGRCRSLGFPATAAATAAHHGHLTPMPCMHNTPYPWMGGKNDYIIKGDPALLKSSTCSCLWGGTISLVADGQIDTGSADMSRMSAEEFAKDQTPAEGLTADNVLDGIQLALDVAGLAPGVGAIPDLLNAAISACRGDWAGAGMSVLAAVPGIGDAATATKFAMKGAKMAKAAETGTKIATKGVTSSAKKTDKVASLAEKRAANVERQIQKSDNVVQFPKKQGTPTQGTASKAGENGGTITRIDQIKMERLKQANGAEVVTVRKIADKDPIIVTNSTRVGGGTNASPSGFENSYNVHSVKSPHGVRTTTEKSKESIFTKEKSKGKNDDNVVSIFNRKKE